MDLTEWQRKLEAGKAKLAEYRKKKGEPVVSSTPVNGEKYKKVDENDRNPTIMDDLSTNNNEDQEEYGNSSYEPSIVDFAQKIEEYNHKIGEYRTALKQRDDGINQLTERLRMTIQQRDRLRDEATVQSEALVTEIDILKLQLQQANEFLHSQKGKNGISAEELLEARNQAIALQQLVAQRDTSILVLKEETTNGLRTKDLENSKLQAKLQNSEREASMLRTTVDELQQELEKVRSDDTVSIEAQIRTELQEKMANLDACQHHIEELKQKSSEEVKQLMEDLQDLQRKFAESQMASKSAEERLGFLTAELDEQYGNQIVEMKAEMGTVHRKEVQRLREELSSVVAELDSLRADRTSADAEMWHEKLRELISEKESLERDHGEQLGAFKERISSLEHSLRDAVEAGNAKLSLLAYEKTALENDYKVRLDTSNERIVALEQILRERSDEYKVQLDLLKSEKENLEGSYKVQLNVSNNRIVTLEQILRDQTEETKVKLELFMSEKQTLVGDYERQLVACKEQIASLEKTLRVQNEESKLRLDLLHSEKEEQNAECHRLITELKVQRQSCEALNAELDVLRGQRDQLESLCVTEKARGCLDWDISINFGSIIKQIAELRDENEKLKLKGPTAAYHSVEWPKSSSRNGDTQSNACTQTVGRNEAEEWKEKYEDLLQEKLELEVEMSTSQLDFFGSTRVESGTTDASPSTGSLPLEFLVKQLSEVDRANENGSFPPSEACGDDADSFMGVVEEEDPAEENSRLQYEIETLRLDNVHLQKELAELNARNGHLDVETNKQVVVELRDRIRNLVSELERRDAEYAKVVQDLSSLRKSYDSVDVLKMTLESKVDEVEREGLKVEKASLLGSTASSLDGSEVAMLHRKVSQLEIENSRLREEVEKLRRVRDELLMEVETLQSEDDIGVLRRKLEAKVDQSESELIVRENAVVLGGESVAVDTNLRGSELHCGHGTDCVVQTYDTISCECGIDVECQVSIEDVVDGLAERTSRAALEKACSPDSDLSMVRAEIEREIREQFSVRLQSVEEELKEAFCRNTEQLLVEKTLLSEELRDANARLLEYEAKLSGFESSCDDEEVRSKLESENGRLVEEVSTLRLELKRVREAEVAIRKELQAQYDEDVEHVRQCLEDSFVQEAQANVDVEVAHLKEKVEANIVARNEQNDRLFQELQELKVQVEQLQADKQRLELSLPGAYTSVDDVEVDLEERQASPRQWDPSSDHGSSHVYIQLLTNITSVVLNLAKTIDKEFVTLLGDAVDSASDGKAAEEEAFDDKNEPYSMQFGFEGGSSDSGAVPSEESFLTFLKDDRHGCSQADVELSLGEIVNEAGNRLSNAVRRLLDLFRESVQQLQDSHVVQDQLANSSLQSNNEVESLAAQNEDLAVQLKSIEQTKDCLAVELTKTTELLRACEVEKCLIQDTLSRKEKQYSQILCQLEEVEARNQSLEESLTEDHCQRSLHREIVAEGIGEHHTQIVHSARNDPNAHLTVTGDEELLEENSRLHMEKRGLQHRGEKDRSQLMLRIQELEQIVEEMTTDRDHLVETKRQETEDLQQQIDALEKQLKAYKHFVEEQTVEREQEREDFHREVAMLNEAMREKEKGLSCGVQLTREVESLTEQIKEKDLLLKQTIEKREQIEREFEVVNDKLNADQELIHELERQLDCKSRNEHDLKEEMDELRMALSNSARAHEDQCQEIEVLRSASLSVRSKTPVPAPFLEDFFDIHGLDTANGSTAESLMLELRSRMHTLEDKVGRHVRDLEAVHFTSSSLSSPCSEEVSVREQLDALRSMSRPDGSIDHSIVAHGLEPSFSEYIKDVHRLEDRIESLTRAKEVAVKKTKDLEAHLLKQKQVEEDLVQDRDVLQQQLNVQLVQISALQARLEEQRLGLRGTESFEKIHILQEELTKQNDFVERKSKQVEDLQEQLSSAQSQVKGYEEQVQHLMEQYNLDVSQSKTAKALAALETNELKNQLAAYKDNLEESKKQTDDLSSLLQTVIQEKNKELDMLTAEIERLEQEKTDSAEVEERSKNQFVELQQTIESLSEELAASKSILAEKDTQVTDLNEKLSSLEKDLKRAVDTVDQKRREVDALKVVLEEKAQLVEQVQMLQSELLNLNNYQQTRLQEDFDVVQSMLEDKQAELANVIQEMAEMQSSRDNSLEEQCNAKNRYEALQKEIADKLASMSDVSIQTDIKMFTELEVLKDEKDQLEMKFIANREELLGAKTELCDVTEQLAAARAQVNELENRKIAALESQLSKIKSETSNAAQQRANLEAEIAWRNSKIFRLEDEVEHLRNKGGGDETGQRSTVHKFLEEVQKELLQEQVDELGSLDLNVPTISTEGSLSESDAESIVETLPPNIRSMVKKIYKEGINVLNLSELKFVQEHSASDPNFAKLHNDVIEKSWENEKLQLVSEIRALKDLLSQVTTLAGSSRTASANTSWLSQLFLALSSLLTAENNLLMATVQSAVVASHNTNLGDIQKLESSLSELKRVFKHLLQAMQRIKSSLDSSVTSSTETKPSSSWDVQMAVAKERLKHQEEQKKLMQELRQLDRQVGQNDRQSKRQTDLLKFRIQQELIIAEDLQHNLDLEKSHCIELCGQLTHEKGRASHLELTTVQLKSELGNYHMTVEQLRQELKNATQLYRTEKARAESLFQALQGERDSFAQLQEAMEAEKRRSKASHVREQQIIDELRNALETEREKQVEVTAALERERLALQRARKTHVDSNLNACLSDDGKLRRRPSETSTSYVEDMEEALDLERRKNQDLGAILQKEHHRVSSLTSSVQQERRQLLRELDAERTTVAQVKCKLEMLESQKNNLVKELQRAQEHSIRLEAEQEKTASDLSSARSELQHREQELDALRHIQQDVQKEFEVEREKERHRQRDMKLSIQKLQQRITFLEKELEFAKSSETNLRCELEDERQSSAFPRNLSVVRCLSLRSSVDNDSRSELLEFETLRQQLLLLLFRVKDTMRSLVSGDSVAVDSLTSVVETLISDASNFSKNTLISTRSSQADGSSHLVLIERIVKHNAELAQFAHELCEEKLQLRIALSKTKDDVKIPSSTHHNQSQSNQVLTAERAVWAQERAVLQRALHRAESELLRNLGTSRQSPLSKIQDDTKAVQFYYKYLRAQSFRKNLIYQKNYLLILLNGYHDTETATLDMLGRLGCLSRNTENVDVEGTSNEKPIRRRAAVRKFRGVVRLVVAVVRMRYLVSKWRRVRNSVLYGSFSSRSNSTARDHEIDVSVSNSVYPAFTPPVRDDPMSRPGSDRSSSPTARRSLLLNNGSTSSSNHSLGALVEYVQRFDSIQQQLGIGTDSMMN